ncbi:S9 family peptidase [Sphingobacterium sp. SRCM116780]|uniref:S9 family peptidase n=1 Tax=Sphingobacterium sp. SRCM116780 TaxID=2907623 RepID=UPI001F21414E|nr:S9 family peptidase [Sphingobacterium sp. SRCM116780]UIR54639.1 S9 family peptidase [Sphingobacterium sp. SRCM116780]
MKYLSTVLLLLGFHMIFAQGTSADYKRAKDLKSQLMNKVDNLPAQFYWNDKGDLFWYDKSTLNGKEYVLVAPSQKKKEILFDTKQVFSAMETQLGKKIENPSISNDRIKLIDEDYISLDMEGFQWTWNRKLNTLQQNGQSTKKERDGDYWGKRYQDNTYMEIESPDKRHVAFIKNSNVYIAPKGNLNQAKQVTFDGNPQEYYSNYIQWSSDSKKLAALKIQKVDIRQLTLIESSPKDQLQPKIQTRDYVKPGDALPQKLPIIYNLEQDRLYTCDQALIDNQFDLSGLSWHSDSHAITFEYNKRGHQTYAVLEMNANTGASRYLIEERSPTFIDYSGKKYRKDIQDGNEIIWTSERDGWNHLYLYDGKHGSVKNQITKGEWVVRKVIFVDETNRKIIFEGSGRHAEEDPYLIHYYTVDFDGRNMTELTKENANHQATFSPDYSQFVDVYSRVDQAPIAVLRDRKGTILMELEKTNTQALTSIGWKAPEVFTAKGRDGHTDIWGIIIRPTNFDPTKSYPVIEYIYAGPHSSFVPKSFYSNPSGMYELAELGFIVVQIDGMGTSNRSKAFQDVCWKNLKDAGFPDRILWMQAAAKKYSYLDISRVGIYGTSAGGQSSTAALLFHPEFYKVGVSSCGCHDNRMDKIWWNEQWMGWPVGPEYAACSNIENAAKLEGNLLLIVGELDDNVDPSSTFQLVNALIKANKNHDFIMVPGMGHSSGGNFGERKRRDYFVKHLLGVDPPAWN